MPQRMEMRVAEIKVLVFSYQLFKNNFFFFQFLFTGSCRHGLWLTYSRIATHNFLVCLLLLCFLFFASVIYEKLTTAGAWHSASKP